MCGVKNAIMYQQSGLLPAIKRQVHMRSVRTDFCDILLKIGMISFLCGFRVPRL